MALIASATGGNSTPAPAGTHVARAVRIIDLGTQRDEGQFGLKIQPKLMISWELPTELHTFKEENGPEPFMLSREYTLNLGDKSNLRKDLENWRGRPFNEAELKGFDVSKIAGATCLLNVIHQIKPTGTYARVGSIAPMMKGVTCPPAILPIVIYDVSMGRNAVFNALPEWVRNKIAKCENWKTQPAPDAEPEPEDCHTLPDDIDLGTHDSDQPF